MVKVVGVKFKSVGKMYYFDPDDYSVDLNSILQKPVASPNKILEKCSWERSAKQWFDLIMEEAQ